MVDRFGKLNYRYLHISCHANSHGIGTTFDTVSNSKLSDMLGHQLRNRRVFVSACEMANEELAGKLLAESEILSFAGPIVRIGFDDAAAFWVSFYHLMFKISERFNGRRKRKEYTQQAVSHFQCSDELFCKI